MNISCPECQSISVGRVYSEREMKTVYDTYICNDCPTQWTLMYTNPSVIDVVSMD